MVMSQCFNCGNLSCSPITLFCGHTVCGTCVFLVTYCKTCYPALSKMTDHEKAKESTSSKSKVDAEKVSIEEESSSTKHQICALCDRCEISDKSKFLLCGHAFCGPCLVWYYEKRRSQKFLLCPTCGFEFIPPSKWWYNLDDEDSEHKNSGDSAISPVSSPQNPKQNDLRYVAQLRNEGNQSPKKATTFTMR